MRGLQPGRETKFVPPPGHQHVSIRSCAECRPKAMALYCKRWRIKRTPEQYEHTLELQRVAYKRRTKLKKRYCQSPGCVTTNGKPRQVGPRQKYCDLCRRAARSWTKTKYRNQHLDEEREKQRNRAKNRGFWHTPEELAKRRDARARAKEAEQGGEGNGERNAEDVRSGLQEPTRLVRAVQY